MFPEIVVPTTLIIGVASIVILPFGIRAAKSILSRVAIGFVYIGIFVMGGFMYRSGVIADEQGIAGDTVSPFFGTEWYFMLAFVTTATLFQVLLIRKRKN